MFASGKTAAVASAANYIEEVFSTYLYTGNGSTQTITNGIDLSTKGGLVWTKDRNSGANHQLFDTARGLYKRLATNSTAAEYNYSPDGLTAFNSNGFTMTGNGDYNSNGYTIASWTFRKQPKFFDVVTYTGDGNNPKVLSHSLGSTPACMIVKSTSAADNWYVYHTSLGATKYINLDTTSAAATNAGPWNNTAPTSTQFTIGSWLNQVGVTYVVYLYASNAGGFGLTGTDNVISCGSVTLNSSGAGTVNLGYEPQWVLMKTSTSANDWIIFDTMRGFSVTGGSGYNTLNPNLSAAEFSGSSTYFQLTNTGFSINMNFVGWQSQTLVYIAIRRGPMKVPTSGTSVYTGVTRTGTGATANITSIGFPTDLVMSRDRQSADADFFQFFDRLRGPLLNIKSTGTLAETSAADSLTSFASMNGFSVGADTGQNGINRNTSNYVYECFKRAPSFFDEVCYTGDGTGGSGRAITHNLGVAPELVIVKSRSNAYAWRVWQTSFGSSYNILLNSTAAVNTNFYLWANTYLAVTNPTTQFGVYGDGTTDSTNTSGATYVAYLFATCAGVSKCTAFTGTGTLQTINCGFTAGSRFVLIKRTDAAGDWYVWDSSRGLSSSTDPYLLLNSTAAEVTSTNWVDTTSTGFQVTAASGNNVNINGASYIALAIA